MFLGLTPWKKEQQRAPRNALLPSVECWCGFGCDQTSEDTMNLMSHLGCMLLREGSTKKAHRYMSSVYTFRKRVLPPDHLDIATSMSDLARTYGALGQHHKALKIKIETLALRKRVLPPDHLDIATTWRGCTGHWDSITRRCSSRSRRLHSGSACCLRTTRTSPRGLLLCKILQNL